MTILRARRALCTLVKRKAFWHSASRACVDGRGRRARPGDFVPRDRTRGGRVPASKA